MSSSSSKNDPVMRQSQSPQSRSGNNSLSPNHHAARKDLPKKGKVVRFQCRHVGCSASFGNSRNREKHETFTCKIFLKSSLADTKSKLYLHMKKQAVTQLIVVSLTVKKNSITSELEKTMKSRFTS